MVQRFDIDQLALPRYANKYVNSSVPDRFEARRTSDRSLLCLDDRVVHVLNDNEPIEIEPLKNDEESSTVATYVFLCFTNKRSFFTHDRFSLIHIAMKSVEYVYRLQHTHTSREKKTLHLGHFLGWMSFEV